VSVFLTTERLKQLPSLAEADEAYLTSLATAACAAVERYCKRTFALTTHTDEAHDGDGSRDIFVRNFPVTDLDKVTIAGDAGDVDISAGDFETSAATGRLRLKSEASCGYAGLPVGLANVLVTYTAGFSPVPGDVIEGAAQLAAHLHAKASRADGVRSERLGQFSRSFHNMRKNEIPGCVRLLLAPYRNVRV
jgi:hypothetical protein